MEKPIGFMSEHTAEFYLVPALLRASSTHGVQAFPFYFWSTREGNRVGVESGIGQGLRIAAIYPRRPKVRHAGDDRVLIKFNHSLFVAAREGEALGLPVLAGVPLVSSLFDLLSRA